MAKKAETETPTPRPGGNDDGAKFVERMENCNQQLDKLRSEHMLACKDVHADKKEILKEAKSAGFSKASIRAVMTARKAERKAEQAREDLDIADRDTFDNIRHQLGDLADLPLGQAAMASNGTHTSA